MKCLLKIPNLVIVVVHTSWRFWAENGDPDVLRRLIAQPLAADKV